MKRANDRDLYFCFGILGLIVAQSTTIGRNFGPRCDTQLSIITKKNCTFTNGKNGVCKKECIVPKTEEAEPCCHYKGLRQFEVYYCCEKEVDFAVVGGEEAEDHEFPYMVALGWFTVKKIYQYEFKCGGAFISPKFVLTAAHCAYIDGQEPNVVLPGGYTLALEEFQIKYTIERVIVHPYYNEDAAYNDIALAAIVGEFELNLGSIDLWRRSYFSNTTFTAIGYGDTTYGGTSSNELLKATLQHVTYKECQEFYKFEENVPSGIINTQMCAQDPKNNMDTCQGDSGGPLIMTVYNSERNQKQEYIVAGTSFGQGCALKTPGIYTRVSSYIEWIGNVMRPRTFNNVRGYFFNNT